MEHCIGYLKYAWHIKNIYILSVAAEAARESEGQLWLMKIERGGQRKSIRADGTNRELYQQTRSDLYIVISINFNKYPAIELSNLSVYTGTYLYY